MLNSKGRKDFCYSGETTTKTCKSIVAVRIAVQQHAIFEPALIPLTTSGAATITTKSFWAPVARSESGSVLPPFLWNPQDLSPNTRSQGHLFRIFVRSYSNYSIEFFILPQPCSIRAYTLSTVRLCFARSFTRALQPHLASLGLYFSSQLCSLQ